MKLLEMGVVCSAVFTTAVDWLSGISFPFTTALNEIVDAAEEVVVEVAVY